MHLLKLEVGGKRVAINPTKIIAIDEERPDRCQLTAVDRSVGVDMSIEDLTCLVDQALRNDYGGYPLPPSAPEDDPGDQNDNQQDEEEGEGGEGSEGQGEGGEGSEGQGEGEGEGQPAEGGEGNPPAE